MTFSTKMKLVNLVLLFYIITYLPNIYCFDCDQNLGCLVKKKFWTYISAADNKGVAHKMETSINYKNVFVFKDKIVFFKATLPAQNIDEQPIPNLNDQMNEAHIERLIPFRHVKLECGKFQTRICHAKNLPLIAKSQAFKKIKGKIQSADETCIAFTFLDESYKEVSEKIAVICISDPRQIKQLLSFKNFLARIVLKYHLLEADSRFDASGGIQTSHGHFITYFKNKPVNVHASFRPKTILLTSDDAKRAFVNEIDLLGMRNTGSYTLRKAKELNKLKAGWSDKLSKPPPMDCCIVMPSKFLVYFSILGLIVFFA